MERRKPERLTLGRTTHGNMGKTATTTKKKAAPAAAAKERVIRLHLQPGRTYSGSLRMNTVVRIMRDSDLDEGIWGMVMGWSPRVMARRIAANAELEQLRAERVKLVQQVVERSREVYGDKGMADRWMQRPNPYLGGKAPQEMLGSLEGIAEVMTELERMDASAFA